MKTWPVYEILKEAATKWPDNPAVYDDLGMLSFQQIFTEKENCAREDTFLRDGIITLL